MLKRSIGTALLCFSGYVSANMIAVTTTEDSYSNDKECSLREAIEYVNLAPETDYMGCTGLSKSGTGIIILEKNKIYNLDKEITISKNLTIKTYIETNVTEEKITGLGNATIKMLGTDRIFSIKKVNEESPAVKLNLEEINLEGCSTYCAIGEGGLIRNEQLIELRYVKLTNGQATLGGAIYSDSIEALNNTSNRAVVIFNSLIENNKADKGAMLYSKQANFNIANSVFSKNENILNETAGIYVSEPSNSDVSLKNISNKITNSTFYDNKGFVIYLNNNIGLNNLTIVGNSAGIIFNVDSQKKAYLTNSILIGNTLQNCRNIGSSSHSLQNNLLGRGCSLSNDHSTFKSSLIDDLTTPVIAAVTEGALTGHCKTQIEDPDSLLCPYQVPEKAFLGYFRPRLSYKMQSLFDSLIINRSYEAIKSDEQILCESQDQRLNPRPKYNVFCDRGAIEITVPTSISLAGQDILMGQTAEFNISEYLADSDLYPKEHCTALLGMLNPAGGEWQDGCLFITQKYSKSKGSLTLTNDGMVVYTPNGNWHGADIFRLNVVTTSTMLNENKDKKYLPIEIVIYQEPNKSVKSDKVKTSGGALGISVVLILVGLVVRRRYFIS